MFIDDKINDKKNDKINDKIKFLDSEIIKKLKENAYMTIPELAEKAQKSEATVYRSRGQEGEPFTYFEKMKIIERFEIE